MTDPASLTDFRVLRQANEKLAAEVERLKSGGGGGIFSGVDVDAKIAAAEARTDTKFALLRGDLAKFATKGTVWGAMGTALGIILAVLAFASNRFDAGVTTGGALAPYAEKQRARDAAQDHKLDEILRRLPTKK